jgi:hypothetical protein
MNEGTPNLDDPRVNLAQSWWPTTASDHVRDAKRMKTLLTVTAVLEAATGLALVARPSAPVALLLGSSLDTPAALTIGQVAGAALLSLGVACWLARNDGSSRAGSGVVAAMLLYNAAVVVVLARAGIAPGLSGIGLWPAVVLHLAMAAWCVACLRVKPSWR